MAGRRPVHEHRPCSGRWRAQRCSLLLQLICRADTGACVQSGSCQCENSPAHGRQTKQGCGSAGHKSGKETLALLKKHGEGKKGQDASYSEEEIKHVSRCAPPGCLACSSLAGSSYNACCFCR